MSYAELLQAIFHPHTCWICREPLEHTKTGHQSLCYPCSHALARKAPARRAQIPTTRPTPANTTAAADQEASP